MPDDMLPEGFQPQARPKVADDESQNFRDRLETRFKANDFVRVINIDTDKFEWSFLPDDSEYMVADRTSRSVYRKEPDHYELEAAESMVIEGSNAYVMIEALYKKVIQKVKVQQMNQPPVQNEYIDKILVGVEDPFANSRQKVKAVEAPVDSVSADLGLDDEPDFPEVTTKAKK